ncbi:MAG TPA: signal peptidase I [Terracidiphilus sp.]|nr:signal peptidase I [Terracidiphilus sp.]
MTEAAPTGPALPAPGPAAEGRPTAGRARPRESGGLLPTVPEALASLLRTLVVALFVLTFIMQPFLIPSESMERTLLVGDFLLCNKQMLAPAGPIGRYILPYRAVRRGDIIVFHHPDPPLLVKRVVGVPGDHLRIQNGVVLINGAPLRQPYAYFAPVAAATAASFPARIYTDPTVDPDWWRQMQSLTHDGQLTVPAGEYFVLGDNRNHSDDSRYWGFVPRRAIVATPLLVYFSLRAASGDDPVTAQAGPEADGKLKFGRGLPEKLAHFARWDRIFHVIH